ncbi:MAG: 4-hydroxy-tetrahydrodipicolinate synthase [Salibacteraceae bacterium]
MKDYRGTGVAMVTPFDSNGKIDFPALEKLTRHLIDGGVDYLVVQGTTGESATLSGPEKQEVLDCVVDVNDGALPIVFGHGGNATKALIDRLDAIDMGGVDAILSASPFYNKPTQSGIIAHYQALANASSKPIIMYNVPGRTCSNMLPDTTLKLAEHKNIIGIKEASGNLDQVGAIIKNKPDNFLVISGDDPLIVPHMALGGDGIISVVANAYPKAFSSIASSCLQGDYNHARKTHYMLVDLIHMLFEEGNPGGVKAVLSIMKIIENQLRLPLVPVSKTHYEKLSTEVNRIRKHEI